MFLVRAALPSV